MRRIILKAVKAVDGGISSRRLGGFMTLYVILALAFFGGIVFLFKDQGEHFVSLIWALTALCTALLGLTTFDHFVKRK